MGGILSKLFKFGRKAEAQRAEAERNKSRLKEVAKFEAIREEARRAEAAKVEEGLLFRLRRCNGSMICGNSGAWLSTQWQVFYDGTLTEKIHHDALMDFWTNEIQEGQIYQYQCRMSAEQFEKFLAFVQEELPNHSAGKASCDGDFWEITSYSRDGAVTYETYGEIMGYAPLEENALWLEQICREAKDLQIKLKAEAYDKRRSC